jgi:ribose transport system permease protein
LSTEQKAANARKGDPVAIGPPPGPEGAGGLPAADDTPAPRVHLIRAAEAYALLATTCAMVVFFSVLPKTSDVFPTAANFEAISGTQAVLAVATIAVLIPLVCEEFDLSVGANAGLCAILAASVMDAGGPLPLAILVAIATGTVVGLINGLIVVRAGISAVIVTLGTAIVIHGVVQARTGGESITRGISADLTDFGTSNTFGIPTILFGVLVVGVLAHYLLAYTPLGRHLYMLGQNREATRLVGLRPDRILLASFVFAGLLAGVAGVMLVARTGAADPRAGEPLLLPALAAAFLSASAIRPGHYNVGGSFTAIAFLAVLNGGLNLMGAEPYVSDFVNGTALIAGVALAAYLGRHSGGGAST